MADGLSESAGSRFAQDEGDRSTDLASDAKKNVPWQIWVVVALLAMEGIGNLLSIPSNPIALEWLLAKCLFILGLIKGWKWIFGLFLVIAGIHVVYFFPINLMASLMNLILILIGLTLSARNFYFPPKQATSIADLP